ncbi:MAG: glycosyltransferase family 4 protein [Desulfobacterales bacterium]|nr:glycosyltransferase family 4 protein [Desulfobacterales bacterium]
MKIAYFSPLPPKKTGIAAYSQRLIPALAKLVQLELFDTDIAHFGDSQQYVIDYVASPSRILNLDTYDVCLYHMGNNPHYHLSMYYVLQKHPGIVVLHDTVLYFLMAGQGKGGLFKSFCVEYGVERFQEYQSIISDSPDNDILRYPYPERYPLLKSVLQQAKGIIVHSAYSARQLQQAGYTGPIQVIPLLIDMERLSQIQKTSEIKRELGIHKDEIVLGCFGFIGLTKRMDSVFRSLSMLKDRLSYKLLIVGVGDELTQTIQFHGLEKHVIQKGYVHDMEFERYLATTDILINLRYPSMGEASYTLIQAMSLGIPCIVTDHAWFSELPDPCVHKIGYDTDESQQLADAIIKIATCANYKEDLARHAVNYVSDNCLPMQVASRYVQFLDQFVLKKEHHHEQKHHEEKHSIKSEWIKKYLLERVQNAIDF